MHYRVDNVPWIWRPVWLAYSWLVGAGWWLLLNLLHLTCRVRIEGQENLPERATFIYCLWHRYWNVWFVAFLRRQRDHVWLQHPAAYMKPVHVMLGMMGIRIVLGSGGKEGREAAVRIAELLQQGSSTAISPDGPSGPPYVLKKGVLHIAAEASVPVVPVRFSAKPALTLPTWDRKIVPLPFARVRVVLGRPVTVTSDNFVEAESQLADALAEGRA